jgi:hypothetical protein
MSATTTKLTDNDMKVLVNFIPDQQLISLKYTSQDTPEVTAVPRSEWSCFWKVTNSFSRLMSCLGLSFFTYYEFRLNRILTHLTKISWSAQLQNASSIESRAYSKVCGLANKAFRLDPSTHFYKQLPCKEVQKTVYYPSLLDQSLTAQGNYTIWWNADMTALDARLQVASQISKNPQNIEVSHSQLATIPDNMKPSLKDWESDSIKILIKDLET